MSATLHSRLRAAIEEKLAIARAAAVLKPGVWIALTTHDGLEFTGHSHVRAEETTPEKSTSRPVAYNIADQLTLTRTAFNAKPEPTPAKVASHIAAHGPAWAIRQHEAALRVLNRHQAIFMNPPAACQECSAQGGDIDWPCVDVRDLADAYGVPVDTEEESRG